MFSYTAEEAVEDGILVNVSEEKRKEAGFKIPVRITSTVHNLCKPPKNSKSGQDYNGRLWDVLSMAVFSIRLVKDDYMCTFKVKIGKRVHELWAMIDNTNGPAIHIMKPEDY